MRHRLFFPAVLVCLLPVVAQASFWVECRVIADIDRATTIGQYLVTVRSATVKRGHVEKGAPCIADKVGQPVVVELEGAVIVGAGRKLKYSYYNDRTEDGVINREIWSVPGFFEKLLY